MTARVARSDQYYCYGCRAVHKFAERPVSPKSKRHNYCQQSWDRVAAQQKVKSK